SRVKVGNRQAPSSQKPPPNRRGFLHFQRRKCIRPAGARKCYPSPRPRLVAGRLVDIPEFAPALNFEGTVDSISYGALPDDGGMVLERLPQVPRSINWVHVSQRFPVKIAVQNPDPALFRVGTSAVATLRRDGLAHDASR
ncbi:HlyD family secretion protein, partial [Burkholderia ubonensis]|uniref:HlyD family secretion protein n=2 Tax=Burkholderia ubonensis TaxID=101571 RepID=UPI003F754C1E